MILHTSRVKFICDFLKKFLFRFFIEFQLLISFLYFASLFEQEKPCFLGLFHFHQIIIQLHVLRLHLNSKEFLEMNTQHFFFGKVFIGFFFFLCPNCAYYHVDQSRIFAEKSFIESFLEVLLIRFSLLKVMKKNKIT